MHISNHLETMKLNEMFLAAAASKPEASLQIKERYTKIKEKIKEYSKLLAELEQNIKGIESNQLANERSLQLPKFGNNNHVDVKSLKLTNEKLKVTCLTRFTMQSSA